ncbi:MAG TPA: hypothetical protein DD000_09095 [Cyanobacteria bacterium UBA11166]|nr:hypothetical protein [Cyanobacteria bacterium UBA11166]
MKIEHLILAAIAILSTSTCQLAATARPLSIAEQEVEEQLQAAIAAQKDEGYQLAFPRTLGKLERGVQAPKTVFLNPNREYSFIAVCDRSCSDVDIIVKDMSGREVASDIAGDAIAIVPFLPPVEGRYEVNVRIKKCAARNCDFGLGVFVKS